MIEEKEPFSISRLTNISSIGFQIQTLIKLLNKSTLTKDDVQNWVDTHKDKAKLNNKDSAVALLFNCGAFKLALKLKDVISSDQRNLLYQILNYDTENYEETMDSINNIACFDSFPNLQDILKIELHLLYYLTFPNKSLSNILLEDHKIKDDNWVTFFNYVDRQHQNLTLLGRNYLQYISYSIVLDFMPSLSSNEVATYRNYLFNDSAFANVFVKLKLNQVLFQVYNCTKKFTNYLFQEETMESLVDCVYETSGSLHSNSISFLKKNFTQNERNIMYSQCFCAYVGAILTENNFYDNPIMKNWIHSLFIDKLQELVRMKNAPNFELEAIFRKNDEGSDLSHKLKSDYFQTQFEDQNEEYDIDLSDTELRTKAQGLALDDDDDDENENEVLRWSHDDKDPNKIVKNKFQNLSSFEEGKNNQNTNEEPFITDEDFEDFMHELKENDKIEFFVSMTNFPDTFTARIFWKNRFVAEYESNSIIDASKKCVMKLFHELDEKTLNYFSFPKPPVVLNKKRIDVAKLIRPSKKRKVKSKLDFGEIEKKDETENENIVTPDLSLKNISKQHISPFEIEQNFSTQETQIKQEMPETLYSKETDHVEAKLLNEKISVTQPNLFELLKTDDINTDSKNILYGLSNRMKAIPEYRYFLQVNGLFLTQIYINNVKIAEAVHRNKKLSSQKAATLALKDRGTLKELGLVD